MPSNTSTALSRINIVDNLQVSRQRCGRITNIFRSLMCLCVQHPHHNRFAGMHSIVESRLLRRLLKWVSFFPVVSSFSLCVFLAVTFFFVLLFHCAICVFLLQCSRLLLPSSKCRPKNSSQGTMFRTNSTIFVLADHWRLYHP